MLPQKTTLNIFRDCLKLIPTMVKEQHKVTAVKQVVIGEFRKNREVTDEKQIEKLRDKQKSILNHSAIRGISNYMIFMIKSEYLKDPTNKDFYSQEALDEEHKEEHAQSFDKP